MNPNNIFASVGALRPKRTTFDLGHEVKFSMNMGKLIPFMCEEVVPGDTFHCDTELFIRMAPMLSPIMHRVNVYTHYFFVPNRLIWNGWEEFITGGEHGDTDQIAPQVSVQNIWDIDPKLLAVGSLWDYLGFPIVTARPVDPSFTVSLMPFRVYQLCFNEYYRDENLVDNVDFELSSGTTVDADEITQLLTKRDRAWEKDYFTSALPWAQKGGEVVIPLGGSAPVNYHNPDHLTGVFRRQDGAVMGSTSHQLTYLNMVSNGKAAPLAYTLDSDTFNLAYDPNSTLVADLSQATAASIEQLRIGFQLQKWLERNARGGTRYIESILAHFGVVSSDARLQRPEYLGGGQSPVVISEVLQTSETSGDSPQGNMSGHGVSAGKTNTFHKFFEEHGWVIGIVSVLPRTSYHQGIPRKYRKFDRFEYFWPEYAHLGEQEIHRSELYYDPNQDSTKNIATFGYNSRYAEYRYIGSRVAGEFRTNLDYWHMGRKFQSPPVLNGDFVQSDPTYRIFAVNDDEYDHLYVYGYNRLRATRPMPFEATPGFIDHF